MDDGHGTSTANISANYKGSTLLHSGSSKPNIQDRACSSLNQAWLIQCQKALYEQGKANETIAALQQHVINLQKEKDDNNKTYTERIGELGKLLADQNARLGTLNHQVAEKDAHLKTMQARLDELQRINSDLLARNQELVECHWDLKKVPESTVSVQTLDVKVHADDVVAIPMVQNSQTITTAAISTFPGGTEPSGTVLPNLQHSSEAGSSHVPGKHATGSETMYGQCPYCFRIYNTGRTDSGRISTLKWLITRHLTAKSPYGDKRGSCPTFEAREPENIGHPSEKLIIVRNGISERHDYSNPKPRKPRKKPVSRGLLPEGSPATIQDMSTESTGILQHGAVSVSQPNTGDSDMPLAGDDTILDVSPPGSPEIAPPRNRLSRSPHPPEMSPIPTVLLKRKFPRWLKMEGA